MRTAYFAQVSPFDPRGRKFPLPDDLMGRLLEYVELLAARIAFDNNQRGVSDDTPKTAMRETCSHMKDLQDRIAMALDARFQVPAAPAAPAAPARTVGLDGLDCWTDISTHAQ
jgi:hypothetical protein